ncbi:MAG TPA: hypothetical protein DDY98_01135 [Ruminococcaceae bacterium]|nr:hypothetical protein [Oscillospiraceae bacterium]
MISRQTVLNHLRQLVTLDSKGAENALSLCELCLDEVKSRLRSPNDENNIRVAKAAAGLAYYRLALRQLADGNGTTSFKAGDVTVSRSPGATVEFAAKVRDESFAQAADLLTDTDFLFRQV